MKISSSVAILCLLFWAQHLHTNAFCLLLFSYISGEHAAFLFCSLVFLHFQYGQLLKYHPPPSILTQIILDYTSFNIPDSIRIPMHNPGISIICKISRDWCFAVSRESPARLKIWLKWKQRWPKQLFKKSINYFDALTSMLYVEDRPNHFLIPVNNVWKMLTILDIKDKDKLGLSCAKLMLRLTR